MRPFDSTVQRRARPVLERLETRDLPSLFGPPLVQRVNGAVYDVRVADFNRDGRADLVTAENGTFHVLLGRGDGSFHAPVEYQTGGATYTEVVGDFNRDGKADVAAANVDGRVNVLLGNGDGTLQAPRNFPAGGTIPLGIAQGDFNNDGLVDLVVANQGRSATTDPGSVSLLRGKGDGTFGPPAVFPAAVLPYRVVAADFNRDGNLDVAVVNTGSSGTGSPPGALSILLGKGDGTFQPAVNRTDVAVPTALVAADFNADGKPDLAIVALNGPVFVLLGNGDGSFGTATPLTVGQRPVDVATADFNGDGKLDLVVPDDLAGTVSYLQGKGDGTFQAGVPSPLAFFGSDRVTAGDLNGDHKPDLILGYYGVQVLLNQPVPLTFNQRYVKALYHDLLDRAADVQGLAFWSGLLDRGVSRFDVALGFQASTEYLTALVTSFYRTYLHRAPDPAGLAAGVSYLSRGGLIERLQEQITGAPEYFRLAGGTNDAFLDALYRDALGRAVDPGARVVFRAALDQGVPRLALAQLVFESDEHRAGIVRSICVTYLGSVDEFSVPKLVANMRAGVTDQQMAALFLSSDEYANFHVPAG